MNYDIADKLIHDVLVRKFGKKNVERRDYYEIEKKKPIVFKGYGDGSGLMFLVDAAYDHYLDVSILNHSKVKLNFRKMDDSIIKKTIPIETLDHYLPKFFDLVNSYYDVIEKIDKFETENVSIDIIRDCKLKEIVK